MTGGRRNNDKDNKAEEGEGSGEGSGGGSGGGSGEGSGGGSGGGWASTFFKVAGAVAATAVVAGSLYSILKQEQVILKVDGSLLRERPSAGCGGFLSSASEKWICGFAQKLNPNLKENETEMEAILRGLRWVKGKGKKKVVVKTDNKVNADLVNSEGRSTDAVICDIRDLLKSTQSSLSWISRGENEVADRLAHKAHSFTSYDLQEIDDPPQNCPSICSS